MGLPFFIPGALFYEFVSKPVFGLKDSEINAGAHMVIGLVATVGLIRLIPELLVRYRRKK